MTRSGWLARVARRPLGYVARLPERARLTVEYYGWETLLVRVLTAPLRVVRLERRVRRWWLHRVDLRRARAWHREHGRGVTVVIPTYGSPARLFDTVRALRKTAPRRGSLRIVVVDDGSPSKHQQALRELSGAELVLASENAGFAAGVNRGLARAPEGDDVVVLNNDVIAHTGWLERLQRAAYADERVGIVGPKLLYPDGRIQSAGSYRNLDQPEWFDHRYRSRAGDHGPAGVRWPALGVTGACMYIKRAALDRIGSFDAGFGMAYEDMDYCLRAWAAGHEVAYDPNPTLTHLEAATRGLEVGERELGSQRHFWEKWKGTLESRRVRTADGALRVIYVTERTTIGGGHRDVFEHLNRLRERGHEAELYSLEGPPDWFPLRAPVRTFGSWDELVAALAPQPAIKVATWWRTAAPVWRASVLEGLPLYFVQDIETSYYPDSEAVRSRVLASYREEFSYMTISEWNRDRLAELGRHAEIIPPGIDLETFGPRDLERRDDVVLALGRTNPLKNLELTIEAWRGLERAPELWLFGVEPELGSRHGARYFEAPSDAEVNELLNRASVFVQSSRHEGFALPPLEAMAAGTPVVCTDAHGNRDFCRDERNCLMVPSEPRALGSAVERILSDPALGSRLAAEGRRTVQEYRWERRIDELEAFLGRLADRAGSRPADAATSAPRGRL